VVEVWGKLNLKDQTAILVVNAAVVRIAIEPLGDAGFEPVRLVAIDDDWTALRVRRVEFIKNLTRPESFAHSKEGKKRTARR